MPRPDASLRRQVPKPAPRSRRLALLGGVVAVAVLLAVVLWWLMRQRRG